MIGFIIVFMSFIRIYIIYRDFLSNIGTILTFAFVGTLFNTFRSVSNTRSTERNETVYYFLVLASASMAFRS